MMVARPVGVAVALWVVWAIVVWNVVFDRILVLAGRRYVYAAALAAQGPGPYLRINDWMQPAVSRGWWTASAAAGTILLAALVLIPIAVRRDARQRSSSNKRYEPTNAVVGRGSAPSVAQATAELPEVHD